MDPERRTGRGGLGPGVGPRATAAAAAVGDSDWLGKWKLHIRLLRAALQPAAGGIPPDDEKMQILLSHCFLQYSEYLIRARAASSSARTTAERRRPSLGTSLEAAFMWLDGWRPSCAVVIVSSLLKAEIGVVSAAVLTNHESTHFLSEEQMRLLQPLQGSIRQAELDLSHQLALLQMLVADQSMLSALTIRSEPSSSKRGVKELMETKMDTYQGLLEQADKLRLQTLEELCKLLTPVQGARASVAAFVIVFMMRTMGGNSTLMRSMSASGLTLEEAIVVDSVITVQNLVTVPIPAGGLATGTSDQAVTLSFPILPAPVFTDAVGVQSSASTLLEVHHNVEEHREDPPSQHPAVVISDISHSTAEKLHIVAPSRSTPHSAPMRPILGTDLLDYPGFDVLRHHPGAFSSDPPNRDLVQLGENFSEAFTHGRSEALLGTGGVDNCNVPGATQCKTPCKTDEPSIESKEVCRYGFKGRAAA